MPLDPPANLTKVDWQTVSWDSVMNAEEYDVYLDGVFSETVTEPNTTVQWLAADVPATGTDITIIAKASGEDDSDPSDPLTWERDVLGGFSGWTMSGDETEVTINLPDESPGDTSGSLGGAFTGGGPLPDGFPQDPTTYVHNDSFDVSRSADGYDDSETQSGNAPGLWTGVAQSGNNLVWDSRVNPDTSEHYAIFKTGDIEVANLNEDAETVTSYDLTGLVNDGEVIWLRADNEGHDLYISSEHVTIDVPTVVGGTNTGTVIKDAATTTTSGTLTITDLDSGEAQYQTRSTTGTYGTFTLGTNGVWTYTINNSDVDVIALTTGQVVSDVFVATSNDGWASQNVTITVRESLSTTSNLAVYRYLMEIR